MDGFGGYTILGNLLGLGNVAAALGVSREPQKVRVVHIFLGIGQLHYQAVTAADLVFGERYAQSPSLERKALRPECLPSTNRCLGTPTASGEMT